MGKTKGPYHEEFPLGSLATVANLETLLNFMDSWKYHNKLHAEQLAYAGKTGRVKWFGFYHGGDELYALEGIPGIWHEQCLTNAAQT